MVMHACAAAARGSNAGVSCGQHTDYGALTIVNQACWESVRHGEPLRKMIAHHTQSR
jgi:hypothetical protein